MHATRPRPPDWTDSPRTTRRPPSPDRASARPASDPTRRARETRVAASGDDELLAAFEGDTLEARNFHHAEHLRVAWTLLRRDPLPQALATYSTHLSRLAARCGSPHLYHETITWFFLFLVHERLASMSAEHDWDEFREHNRDLFVPHRELLSAYYSPDRLDHPLARRAFLLPDRRAQEARS